MAGDEHVERLVGLALHADALDAMLRGEPLSVRQILIRCRRAEAFDVEILDSLIAAGHTERDVPVVSDDDSGYAGQRETGGVERAPMHVCDPPRAWQRCIEMR